MWDITSSYLDWLLHVQYNTTMHALSWFFRSIFLVLFSVFWKSNVNKTIDFSNPKFTKTKQISNFALDKNCLTYLPRNTKNIVIISGNKNRKTFATKTLDFTAFLPQC